MELPEGHQTEAPKVDKPGSNDLIRIFFTSRKAQRDFIKQLTRPERETLLDLVAEFAWLCNHKPESKEATDHGEKIATWIFRHSHTNSGPSKKILQAVTAQMFGWKKQTADEKIQMLSGELLPQAMVDKAFARLADELKGDK